MPLPQVPAPALLVFDFDGVLTDNRVWVFEDGEEAVSCSRADGLAFDMLRDAKIPAIILSTEKNPVVSQRGKKLQIDVLQAVADKAGALAKYCGARGITLEEVVYIGNDLNDLPAMRIVGCAVAVADAHPVVKERAHLILLTSGGQGVAREIVEDYLQLPSKYL